MELEIPELKQLSTELSSLKNEIKNIKTDDIKAEWYNDEECWKRKGGMALNTYRNNRYFQCKGGIPDGFVGGRKVWSKNSLLEWIPLTDAELEEYHEKYGTGAKRK